MAEYQSGSGFWHQMVDRNDSYLETSATAMFTYGIAHAVNQGWISPVNYGTTMLAGVERIKMRKNPAFTIDYKLRTYHYVPKDGGPTSYRKHRCGQAAISSTPADGPRQR